MKFLFSDGINFENILHLLHMFSVRNDENSYNDSITRKRKALGNVTTMAEMALIFLFICLIVYTYIFLAFLEDSFFFSF